MKEKWKPVVDYPNYRVSNLGRVRSTRGFLNPWLDYRGYRLVAVYHNDKIRRTKVARLVLEAFRGLKEGYEVDHRNRIRSDDRLSNLRWLTHAENTLNKGVYKNSISKVTGVTWNKGGKTWMVRKTVGKKSIYLGCRKDINDAINLIGGV